MGLEEKNKDGAQERRCGGDGRRKGGPARAPGASLPFSSAAVGFSTSTCSYIIQPSHSHVMKLCICAPLSVNTQFDVCSLFHD